MNRPSPEQKDQQPPPDLSLGRNRSPRVGWVGLLVVLLLAAGLGCLYLGPARGKAVHFKTLPVRRGPLTVLVSATGALQPIHQVDVGGEISGLIAEVLLNLKTVPAGYRANDSLPPRSLPPEVERLFPGAYRVDPDLAGIEQNLKTLELDRTQPQDPLKSDLGPNLSDQRSGYAATAGGARTALEESAERGYQVGPQWQIPPGDRRRAQKLFETDFNRENLLARREEAKKNLEISLQTHRSNLVLAQESVRRAKNTARLNQVLLDKEILKFRNGRSTGYRVSRTRQDLPDSELA